MRIAKEHLQREAQKQIVCDRLEAMASFYGALPAHASVLPLLAGTRRGGWVEENPHLCEREEG